MGAFSEVQQDRGTRERRTRLGHEVIVYPNVVILRAADGSQMSFSPGEWGEIVQFVGITDVEDFQP